MRCDEIMTHDVVSLRPGDRVQRAEALMAARHKTRIIVVEPDGRLAGVMSLADIAEHEDDARALRTIRGVLSRELRGAGRGPAR